MYVIAKEYNKSKMPAKILTKLIKNYLNESTSLISTVHMPQEFIQSVIECATKFSQFQIDVIEKNIWFFYKNTWEEQQRIRDLRELLTREYLVRYEIKAIQEEKKILYGVSWNKFSNILFSKTHCDKVTGKKFEFFKVF